MKKLVSLRIQKILMLIPFVNCVVPYIFLFNCIRTSNGQKVVLRSLLILFGLLIPIAVAQRLLYKAISQYELLLTIINPIIIYIILFVIAFTLIKCQEKYLGKYFNH